MSAKKSGFESHLYSTVGVGLMFTILVAFYIVTRFIGARVDMTQEKLYTLSEGTRQILKRLDTPIDIRLFVTQGKDMPVELKTYAQRVEDLLNEYRKASKNIQIKKFDPQPETDAEDAANLAGIEGQSLGMGSADKVYLGLAINMFDAKAVHPFLDPRRERLLEYDLSRSIASVMTSDKPVVGVMSSLPVFGEMNPMAMRMGGGGKTDPWVAISELKKDFSVREVQMTSDKIDDDIKILIVVHPKGITEKAQFALDQFVLRGGKLIALLDPLSIVDAQNNRSQNPLQAAASGGSSLDKLTKAWGVEFDGGKVVADMLFKTKINRGGGRAEEAPAVLSITTEGVSTNDVVTSQVDGLLFPFSGAFAGTPTDGLKKEVLVHTTSNSQQVDRFMAEFSSEQIGKDFASGSKELALAIRLTGKFKTAFPDGAPKDAAADKKDEPKDKPTALKESAKDSTVILVGDADFIYDQFAGQVQDFMGQKLFFPRNSNLPLLQNMVEQLTGDNSLISIRSRATMNRPFTKVREMQAKAEDRFRAKIKELEKTAADAQTRLTELQQKKDGNQRFILSAEQQAEVKKFRENQANTKKELRQVQKDLRREVDSLENRLKWINIAGMPFFVALSGVSLAILKRKKTAAK